MFMVNGKPFFSLGGQARNSSGYNDAESERAFQAVKAVHGNTLEIPVYWEQVEPEEGRFDFASVDALIARAREVGIKLVLLWFATWKNGDMDYTPAWVKTNPQCFKRVVTPTGRAIWVLSSHCQANLEADKRAFVALCAHLKAVDGDERGDERGDGRTVIALQIENEPGILGSDRDYGPEAQAAFDGPVSADLVAKLQTKGAGRVFELWQAAGGKSAGTWPELFGWAAGELLTAWSIATYIDHIAKVGKAIHDIPMYINVWLGEGGWSIPGETYPSGGAVSKVLDIYKWCAPHVDLIAPDIYIADSRGYEAACATYARDDNPLFVPESAPRGSNAWLMFRAIADYGAVGYHHFAVEQVLSEDNVTIRPESRMLVDSFRCVAAIAPLLLQYRATGKIYAVVEEENLRGQRLDLDGYVGLVEFGGRRPTDWRHAIAGTPEGENRGRGLVIQTGRHEFYLAGANFRLHLRPTLSPEENRDMALSREQLLTSLTQYVSIEEGHFDDEGTFTSDRWRNGDEANHGVWVEPDVGVVRVLLCE